MSNTRINKPKASIANRAIIGLQEQFANKAFNASDFKMESFGTSNDTFSGGVLNAIKSTLREAGFGHFAGRKSKVYQPGDHLRPSLKLEDAAEGGSATEGTQNEEILLTEAQEKAGIQAAAMADAPAEWAAKAVEASNEAKNQINNTEEGVEFAERVKLEPYDDQAYRDAVGYSVVWNIVAARQSNGVENIFPTITLEPGQSHVEAIVQFQVFHQEVRHKSTGDRTDFGRILLLETIINGEILDEDIIKCVPVFEDAVSNHHFIAPTIIAHHEVTVEGETVTTGPLLPDVEHNLLGLSQAAIAGLEGELNTSAQLAPMPKLENLYIKLVTKSGTSYIRYPSSRLGRASFTHNLEGNIRDIALSCILKQLTLDANTVDVTGAPAKALDFLRVPEYQSHRIGFGIKAFGEGNLETGNVEVNGTPGRVNSISIQQALGHFASEKDTAIVKELTDAVTEISLAAFDIDASRTNIDRQQRGPLTNVTSEFEKYYVRLRSPISTIFPATEATSNVDLIAPMTATRIKNDFYAIRSLYQFADILAAQTISEDVHIRYDDLKAIGKWIMKPYYKHVTISMLDILDSNRSKYKLEDMQHAFLNYIRDLLIHGMRDSRYELALQVQTGSAENKPTIAMLTNQVLGKYLFQLGDTRILGSLPYPVVADTHASKLLGEYRTDEHELFIVPTLPGTQMNPLNFAHHLWKPELASTLQVTRNGSTNREIVVQACNEWHMVCPLMIRVTVTDLTHAMTSKTPLAVLV